MKKMNLKQLVLAGLMAAMVLIGTMIIQVPTPTRGYIHLGDTIVYLAGIILGPVTGGLSAAVGSFLADLLSGYAHYAIPTFLIKGFDAFLVGTIYHRFIGEGEVTMVRRTLVFGTAVVAGGIVMVGGYYFYEALLYGAVPALAGIPGNITQALGGGLLALPILLALEKTDAFKLATHHK